MKVIVGLGNPGERYRHTRHNLGYMVVDELARRHGLDLTQEKFHAWFGLGDILGEKVALAKPTTFMNRSGQAVLAIGRFYKLELPDLLIVTDDLALPLGRLRLRPSGSAGGHNGLLDIAARLGTQDFARLRIGIDAAAGNAVQHVLSEFDEREQAQVAASVRRAADAVECWISSGIQAAMNAFNGLPQDA